jgi:hypothetical protein
MNSNLPMEYHFHMNSDENMISVRFANPCHLCPHRCTCVGNAIVIYQTLRAVLLSLLCYQYLH